MKPAIRSARGVTLVELLISIAVLAALLAVAVPNFAVWIQNSQIRSATDGILNGLQLARATAVQRNTVVNLYVTTSLTASCALSLSGSHWVVALDDPTGSCGSAPSATVAPRIVQSRSGSEGGTNTVMDADQSTVGFNGLGRRVNAGTAAYVNFDITNPGGGTCALNGGDIRCLRVVVSASGQVRSCDPAVTSTDPRGC